MGALIGGQVAVRAYCIKIKVQLHKCAQVQVSGCRLAEHRITGKETWPGKKLMLHLIMSPVVNLTSIAACSWMGGGLSKQ